MKNEITILLLQFQYDTNNIVTRFMPDNIGSDAYISAMKANLLDYLKRFEELYKEYKLNE